MYRVTDLHHSVPVLARRKAEQREHADREGPEVGGADIEAVYGAVRVILQLDVAEQVHAQDGEDEQEEQQDGTHVAQGRQRIQQGP